MKDLPTLKTVFGEPPIKSNSTQKCVCKNDSDNGDYFLFILKRA